MKLILYNDSREEKQIIEFKEVKAHLPGSPVYTLTVETKVNWTGRWQPADLEGGNEYILVTDEGRNQLIKLLIESQQI